MPYAAVRDLEMYYELSGSEDAEPLLLFSGAFGVIGPNSDWSKQFAPFAEHYRLIAFEHRGHGRTNNPRNEFTNYGVLADDAVALLHHLNIPKVHMVGFSDGAITLLDLAQRYPQVIDTLVIVGANYYNDDTIPTALNALRADYIEEKYPAWAATLEEQHKMRGVGYWKTLANQLREMWLTQPNFTSDDLSFITVPTLVMTGQYDPYGNLQQTLDIHRAIKGSELCILPGASHPCMSQRPEIATSIILDFITRQRKKRNKKK